MREYALGTQNDLVYIMYASGPLSGSNVPQQHATKGTSSCEQRYHTVRMRRLSTATRPASCGPSLMIQA